MLSYDLFEYDPDNPLADTLPFHMQKRLRRTIIGEAIKRVELERKYLENLLDYEDLIDTLRNENYQLSLRLL